MDEARLWTLARAGDVGALPALLRHLQRRAAPADALARFQALCDQRAPLLACALAPPSAAAWARLCDALDRVADPRAADLPTPAADPAVDPATSLAAQLRGVEAALHLWPDALRRAPEHWLDAARRRLPCPGWPLARCVRPVLAWWGELAKLDADGALCHITHLDLSRQGLSGGDEVRALTRLPLFAQLAALDLSQNAIGAQGVEALSRAPHPSGLRALNLSGNGLQDALLPLQSATALARLTDLDLSRNSLADASFSAAAACPPFRGESLRALNLSVNRLRDRSLRALARAAALGGLADLDLSDNRLEAGAAPALLALPARASLQRLSLAQNRLGPDGIQRLCTPPSLPHLVDLDLRNNLIGPRGCRALAAAPFLPALTALRLDTNWITDAGLDALCASDGPQRLATLSLPHNMIEDAGATRLAETPWGVSLRTLDLSHNLIGDAGARALAQSPHLRHLTHLDLRDNPISDAGAQALRASDTLRRAYVVR
jgi:Ran GTPase-activating protein (RanGAP) involved in mRNA processing and transport